MLSPVPYIGYIYRLLAGLTESRVGSESFCNVFSILCGLAVGSTVSSLLPTAVAKTMQCMLETISCFALAVAFGIGTHNTAQAGVDYPHRLANRGCRQEHTGCSVLAAGPPLPDSKGSCATAGLARGYQGPQKCIVVRTCQLVGVQRSTIWSAMHLSDTKKGCVSLIYCSQRKRLWMIRLAVKMIALTNKRLAVHRIQQSLTASLTARPCLTAGKRPWCLSRLQLPTWL